MDARIVVPLHPNFFVIIVKKDEKDCFYKPLSVVSRYVVC